MGDTSQDYNIKFDGWQKGSEYWSSLIKLNNYSSLLEVGTCEGGSIIRFVDCGIRYIHCIDVWKNEEHKKRFDYNKNIMLKKHKDLTIKEYQGWSYKILSEMLLTEYKLFDIVYIDASHYPHNTLLDGCMAFRLLRVGGTILFDDYEWIRTRFGDADDTPKIAVDCFEQTHKKYIERIPVHPYQRAWRKIENLKNYG